MRYVYNALDTRSILMGRIGISSASDELRLSNKDLMNSIETLELTDLSKITKLRSSDNKDR